MLKRALLIGINDYTNYDALHGCVNDVNALLPLLSRHHDDSPNFHCHPLTSDVNACTREELLKAIDVLLKPGADVAVLYFAGHGAQAPNDVVLVPRDGKRGDEGITLSALLGKVQASRVNEILIILDCCFAGGAGGIPQFGSEVAALRSGVSILSAARSDQSAMETEDGRGQFSTYLCGALEGGAADVLGRVTVASVYAYLSESFGPWNQRPTFKANVDRLHELRICLPAVPFAELRRLPELFESPTAVLPLDPSYEPTEEPHDLNHEQDFKILQRCRAAKLVEPVGADHLYFAAVQSASCMLTPLGQHYWRMASQNRL